MKSNTTIVETELIGGFGEMTKKEAESLSEYFSKKKLEKKSTLLKKKSNEAK